MNSHSVVFIKKYLGSIFSPKCRFCLNTNWNKLVISPRRLALWTGVRDKRKINPFKILHRIKAGY